MEIRFANTGDIPGLIDLLAQIGQIHHNGRPDMFRGNAQKYSAAELEQLLQDETRPILVAAEEGRVIGYALCIYESILGDSVRCDYRNLYLDDLCVDENCRSGGIGKQLLDAVVDYAREKGFDGVTLNCWSFNHRARKFYDNYGFTPQKTVMEMRLEGKHAD